MNIIRGKLASLDAHVAIVVAEYNSDITSELLNGSLSILKKYLNHDNITVVWVPGAVEIPHMVQKLAQTKKFDAIIALGAVIYGETDHYHYVCQLVSTGCQQVMLTEAIPVMFGVLTVQNKHLALDRIGGNKGHMGKEVAEAVIKTLSAAASI